MRFLGYLSLFLVGSSIGLGIYLFIYAEGYAYLSKDPQVCVNCHVMNTQYKSWSQGGHHHVANCNDCHLGQSGISKWTSKIRNGFNHSLAFTTGDFKEPIQITPTNEKLLIENCQRCHDTLVHEVTPAQSCLHCHRNVGHYPRF